MAVGCDACNACFFKMTEKQRTFESRPNNALEQSAASSFGEVAGMCRFRINQLRSVFAMPRGAQLSR